MTPPPPEGHPGQLAYTFLIRIISTSFISVSIFSVCCYSIEYLSRSVCCYSRVYISVGTNLPPCCSSLLHLWWDWAVQPAWRTAGPPQPRPPAALRPHWLRPRPLLWTRHFPVQPRHPAPQALSCVSRSVPVYLSAFILASLGSAGSACFGSGSGSFPFLINVLSGLK